MANETRGVCCLAVLLAAKGGPSLLFRCAHAPSAHYLTPPPPAKRLLRRVGTGHLGHNKAQPLIVGTTRGPLNKEGCLC